MNIRQYAKKHYPHYRFDERSLIIHAYKKLYEEIKPCIKPLKLDYISQQQYTLKGYKIISNTDIENVINNINSYEDNLGELQFTFIDNHKEEIENSHLGEYVFYRECLQNYPNEQQSIINVIDNIHKTLNDFINVKQIKALRLTEYIKYFNQDYIRKLYLQNYSASIVRTNWIYGIQDMIEYKLHDIQVDIFLQAASIKDKQKRKEFLNNLYKSYKVLELIKKGEA